MSVSFDFQMKYPDLVGKFKKQLPEIKLAVAAAMQFNRGMRFANSGAYNGHAKWAPLKLRQGQPLKDTGTLSKSLAPNLKPGSEKPGKANGSIVKVTGNIVSIGTNLHYAAMMNWGTTGLPGGVLRPVKAKALRIPLPGGDAMYRMSVKIPARRFDDWTTQDRKDIESALKLKLQKVLKT